MLNLSSAAMVAPRMLSMACLQGSPVTGLQELPQGCAKAPGKKRLSLGCAVHGVCSGPGGEKPGVVLPVPSVCTAETC